MDNDTPHRTLPPGRKGRGARANTGKPAAPLPVAPDLRRGIAWLTALAFGLLLVRLWGGLDLQPGPLTAAVRLASETTMDAYIFAIGIALFGLFALLRFIIAALVNGLAAQAGAGIAWLCFGTAGLLAAAIVTPFTAGMTGLAVIGALGSNWAVEAARLRRARG